MNSGLDLRYSLLNRLVRIRLLLGFQLWNVVSKDWKGQIVGTYIIYRGLAPFFLQMGPALFALSPSFIALARPLA